MYGLLYKEIVMNKKQFLFAFGCMALFSSMLFIQSDNGTSDEIFLFVSLLVSVLTMLVVGMIQQSIYEYDEIGKWHFFVKSAPNGIYNEPINQDKELKKISDHDIIIIKQKKNGGQIYGRANNIYSRVQEQNSD